MSEPLFYIQDKRTFVGNCPLWWAKNDQGYTCHLARAEKYSEYEAAIRTENRETDEAWPVEYIDGIASLMIDHQHMDRTQSKFSVSETGGQS